MRSAARALAAALAFTVPTSGTAQSDAPAQKPTVIIGMPNWPTAEVTANIIAQVLRQNLDVETRLRPIGTVELFDAIDTGQVDIHPEVWLPNSSVPVEEYTDVRGTMQLAPARVTATQNICTTRATAEATGLRHVRDLTKPQMAANFDTDGDGLGEMWIGAFEWSAHRIERLRARSYGYDETMMLLTMPEDMAMAAVDAAVATGAPMVFYCYAPHHLFALHDIVRLEEPAYDPATWNVLTPEEDPAWLDNSVAASGWEPARYHIGYATDLAESLPRVTRFLDNMALTAEDAQMMSYEIHVAGREPAEVAADYIAANADAIVEWLK